jgi:ligand-binding SRPBCC domain-containing protein
MGKNMKKFHSKAIINAPAKLVWEIITKKENFPFIDPNCLNLDGIISEGQYLQVHHAHGKYKTKVHKIEPLKLMIWQSALPLNLYKRIKMFRVIAKDDQTTEFHVSEVFQGYLASYFA